MRKIFLAGCVVFLMIGALPVALAQTEGAAPSANCPETPEKIAAILEKNPDGGSGLSAAIAEAVEADPCSAPAVVAAALTATPAQQQAIGVGLALAVAALNATGTAAGRAGAQQILAAMASSVPPGTLAAFTLASLSFGSPVTGGTGGGTNLTTNSCVSPSAPGATC
jgi:hypothetical protein